MVRRLDRKILRSCFYIDLLSAIDFHRFTTREQYTEQLFWIRWRVLGGCALTWMPGPGSIFHRHQTEGVEFSPSRGFSPRDPFPLQYRFTTLLRRRSLLVSSFLIRSGMHSGEAL
jgi:hypothetical protein